jgi:hypothetical protein
MSFKLPHQLKKIKNKKKKKKKKKRKKKSLGGWLGSSGTDLNLGDIPIKSNVQIPFRANNSLGLRPTAKSEPYPIHVEGVLYMSPEFARHK